MHKLPIIILSISLYSSIAWSDTDWKTYPGTMCQPGHNTEIVDYDAFGGICNHSDSLNLVVHCSVVRDYSKSKFPILVRHSGRSGHPAQNLQCRLRSMKRFSNDSGSAMEFSVVDLVPIAGASLPDVITEETDLKHIAPGAADFGAMVLTCDLPPYDNSYHQQNYSCLYNYSIQEWDGN